jgi:hypothetical protein
LNVWPQALTPRSLSTSAIDAKLMVPAALDCPDYRQYGLGEFVRCRDLDWPSAGARPHSDCEGWPRNRPAVQRGISLIACETMDLPQFWCVLCRSVAFLGDIDDHELNFVIGIVPLFVSEAVAVMSCKGNEIRRSDVGRCW